MGMNETFLAALSQGMPGDERMILCGFRGDPNAADPTVWRPRPWKPGADVPFARVDNAYCTVASFRQAADKSWRRRGELFAGGRALMVDDLGTKIPMETIDPLAPSALIETSPGNFQAWYFLDRPEPDRVRFDSVIRAFIDQKLLGGVDTGMAGVTRVGRLPEGANGKEKYKGFQTIQHAFEPDRRYSIATLLEAFDLKLGGRREPRQNRLLPTDVGLRVRAWAPVHDWLRSHDMLKKDAPDMSGWIEMRCPWVDGHTGRADTGAAMREPHEENGYYGGFRCHHGHCIDRGWRDLTEYIAEEAADELNDINLTAGDME